MNSVREMILTLWYNSALLSTFRHLVKTVGALLPILAAILIGSTSTDASEELHIHLQDVGQGDAMVLHQPGGCTVLIDAGPVINGHLVTRHLAQIGISSLDMIIISHPHLDHFGGLFDLLPRIPAQRLYDNGLANKSWEYFDDYQALRTAQPYEVLARGRALKCGEIEIDVLHPEPHPNAEDTLNNNSLAVMIRFSDFRLLHMGDLAGDGAAGFLETSPDLEADVIKIAHHGASDSASPQLLERASPDLALISTGSTNRIGSPDKKVLNRLENMHIPYLRTDLSGDITIVVGSGSYEASPVISR